MDIIYRLATDDRRQRRRQRKEKAQDRRPSRKFTLDAERDYRCEGITVKGFRAAPMALRATCGLPSSRSSSATWRREIALE